MKIEGLTYVNIHNPKTEPKTCQMLFATIVIVIFYCHYLPGPIGCEPETAVPLLGSSPRIQLAMKTLRSVS